MPKDGKNNFYRLLNLDKETKTILKWYRSIFKEIQNEYEGKILKKEKNGL